LNPVVFVLLVGASHLQAATYYVDQTSGSDANSGISAGAPWKNCPGMRIGGALANTGHSLSAGDTVYLAKGDTWQVAASGNGGFELKGGVTYIGDSFMGDSTGTSRAKIQASGTCEAGVVRFFDHATLETVFRGFEVDANSSISSGIDINHRYNTAMNGATKRVLDCEVHHTWSRQASGQYKYGIIVSSFVAAGGTPTANVEIFNCKVHDTSRDGICLYPGDQSADCLVTNVTVRGCEVYNTGQDPDYSAGAGLLIKGHVVNAFLEYNYSHDTHGAAAFINGNETNHFANVGPTNIHLRYNLLTCSNASGAIRVYDDSTGHDPKDLKIYGNVVFNSPITGGLYIGPEVANSLSLLVYNNTFYNAPVIVNSSANILVFELKNNIIFAAGGPANNLSQVTASSNNLLTNPGFKNAASFPSGFTGAYGVDLAPNSDGLAPQAVSPAIEAGTNLPSPYNGSINSVTRPSGSVFDLGAWEQVAATGAPNAPTNLQATPD